MLVKPAHNFFLGRSLVPGSIFDFLLFKISWNCCVKFLCKEEQQQQAIPACLPWGSQNGWDGKSCLKWSKPPAQAGSPKAAALHSVQLGFNYLYRWRLCNHSGQSFSVFGHPQSKRWNVSCFSLYFLPLVLSLGIKRSLTSSLQLSIRYFINITKSFSRLSSLSSLSLSSCRIHPGPSLNFVQWVQWQANVFISSFYWAAQNWP